MSTYPDALVKRVANVLLWFVSTGNHPDASFEGGAEQILKVIEHEGYLLTQPVAPSGEPQPRPWTNADNPSQSYGGQP